MASIANLVGDTLGLTLKDINTAERQMAQRIQGQVDASEALARQQAAQRASAALDYGKAAGGGNLNEAYMLTQMFDPTAAIQGMSALAGAGQQFAAQRAGAREADRGARFQQAGLQLNYDQLKAQEASDLEKVMAGVGGIASIASLFSTEAAKKNIKKAPNTKLLADVKNMEIKEFEYKPGLGPMGKRIGMIIEENPAEFERGQKTVTGGDLYNFIGKLTGAVQALDDKISKIVKGGK